jgi:membrane complex biogenesis BtpA family protein
VLSARRSGRGVIGVVHLPALPGDPGWAGGPIDEVFGFAVRDAEALAAGGCDAIIVENFGSAPFARGTRADPLPPEQVSAMTLAVASVGRAVDVPLGVNCLRNDARAALAIAATTGARFIRVNIHTGAYVTDQGVIEGDAASTLRERQRLGLGDVAILADILVKHASPLAPLSAEDATKDTLLRGRADGVIVTGRATGAPTDVEQLRRVREAAGDGCVLVGSGMNLDNARQIAPLIEGAIVGTYFKRDGQLSAPVDADRVRRLVEALDGRLRAAGTP